MDDPKPVPRAPAGLGRRGKALWTELHTEFDFAGEPHRRVLVEDACREADLIDRLQRAVTSHDLRVRGSQAQPVIAPEVSELRLHRKALADILRALALPDAEDDDVA
ncbi:hypothetical protein XA26_45820 [Mycolicibacterium fortuitum]|uniref:Uncharacterized protein n=1 Tax=Mycolicibacterium fortuitum TaxID=1766 RepID=A0A0N9Y5C7_MYCFO|nr:hypothetical protein [Mycolicibacterium fortuitum]ALI28382.1 hypothetical protein XA26_45820 [Mycolicibacterium fortuitum]